MGAISGVNLDYRNPAGSPPVSKLAGFRYVRFLYAVPNHGGQDFDATRRYYLPTLQALRAAGITVVLIVNWQTRGEGLGFNWNAMSDGDWQRYEDEQIRALEIIVPALRGLGILWQIGNEHDNDDPENVASFFMPAAIYWRYHNRARRTIRQIEPGAKVVIGGIVTGPGKGIPYFEAGNGADYDYCAIHLYGVGAAGLYQQHGVIGDQLAAWLKVVPASKLMITEFGVINLPDEPVARVAQYSRAFMAACAGKVVAAFYFAWGRQHNGYPIEIDGVIRQPLFDALTSTSGGSVPTPVPEGLIQGSHRLDGNMVVNIREAASTGAPVVGKLKPGDIITIAGSEATWDGTYLWQNIGSGYVATRGGVWTWTFMGAPVVSDVRADLLEARAIIDRALAKL